MTHNRTVFTIKNVFRIIGWVMFLIFSVKFLIEFSGIKMFDTVLFSLGGKSVGLQNYSKIIDISPWATGVIYFLVISINVVSIFNKRDYIIFNMTNLVLGVLLLMIYAPVLKDYFPFGKVEWHVPALFNFIFLAYLSIVIAGAEVVWLMLRKTTK